VRIIPKGSFASKLRPLTDISSAEHHFLSGTVVLGPVTKKPHRAAVFFFSATGIYRIFCLVAPKWVNKKKRKTSGFLGYCNRALSFKKKKKATKWRQLDA
jgi:hypothetical protein